MRRRSALRPDQHPAAAKPPARARHHKLTKPSISCPPSGALQGFVLVTPFVLVRTGTERRPGARR